MMGVGDGGYAFWSMYYTCIFTQTKRVTRYPQFRFARGQNTKQQVDQGHAAQKNIIHIGERPRELNAGVTSQVVGRWQKKHRMGMGMCMVIGGDVGMWGHACAPPCLCAHMHKRTHTHMLVRGCM